MEEDGDAVELLQRIQEALVAGGYYRAGISSLSPFDKLTGGLAWSITASNVDVDFDVFFDDDATLGEKIKVGEAIESSLRRMGCPYPLQAHQIQGLDYKAVLPVVQWLVKRVKATREQFGDQLRRYALFWFREHYDEHDEVFMQKTRLQKLESGTFLPGARRLYRRAKNTPASTNLIVRLRSTLLEYGHQISRVDMAAEEQPALEEWSESENLVASSADAVLSSVVNMADFAQSLAGLSKANDGTLSGRIVRRIVGLGSEDIQAASQKYSQPAEARDADQHQHVAVLKKQIEVHTARLAHLQADEESASLTLQNLENDLRKQDECKAQVQAKSNRLQAEVDAAKAWGTVQKLLPALKQFEILEKQETQFRVDCRQKRNDLLFDINSLRDQSTHCAQDDERSAELTAIHNGELDRLRSLRVELASKIRGVAQLQRRLDDVPTQSELIQYERRFVELFLHIQGKLRETRKYYGTYNALAEAHEITLKETSLLNSIHSQFDAAMLTSGGRAKFLESMEVIAKGVQQKLDKIVKRFQAERSKDLNLKEKHAALVAQQRQYVALIKVFQEECARNENLHALLEKRGQS